MRGECKMKQLDSNVRSINGKNKEVETDMNRNQRRALEAQQAKEREEARKYWNGYPTRMELKQVTDDILETMKSIHDTNQSNTLAISILLETLIESGIVTETQLNDVEKKQVEISKNINSILRDKERLEETGESIPQEELIERAKELGIPDKHINAYLLNGNKNVKPIS